MKGGRQWGIWGLFCKSYTAVIASKFRRWERVES